VFFAETYISSKLLWQQASKQASQQASKQSEGRTGTASRQTSKPACLLASQPASKHTSKGGRERIASQPASISQPEINIVNLP